MKAKTFLILGIVVIVVFSFGFFAANYFNDLETGKRYLKYFNYFGDIKKFQQAISKNPEDIQAHLWLGIAYGKKRDYANAVKEFELVRNTAPQFPVPAPLHYEIGMIYYLAEEYNRAMEEFSLATNLDSKFIDAFFNLGIVLSTIGKVEEAVRAYEHVISLDPSHAYSHWNLAICYERLGQTEKAIHHWQNYMDIVQIGRAHV